MGKPTLFEIVLDRENDTYNPGDWVKGTVNIDLPEPLHIRCCKVVLWGYARTRYWNYLYAGVHIAYPSTGWEEYFNEEIVLGKAFSKDGYEHPAGRHSYTFEYQLPPNLPSSFELPSCDSAKVRYYAEGVLQRGTLKSNYTTMKIFSVIPTYDLNTIQGQNLSNPCTKEKSKTICCCSCASAPIEGTITVPRTGYVPGETITYNGEVENHSGRRIKRLIVELRQVAIGYCTSPWRHRRCFARTLAKTESGPVEAKGSGKISGSMVIPPVPPSSPKEFSGVVKVIYQIRLIADPAGASLDLHVPIELTIGNVPLVQQFEEMNKTVLQSNPAGIDMDAAGGAPPSLVKTDILATNLKKKKPSKKVFVPNVRTYCYTNEAFDDVDPKVNVYMSY